MTACMHEAVLVVRLVILDSVCMHLEDIKKTACVCIKQAR